MTNERDAELSALLDDALAPLEESALRAELARDPALAARLAQLAQVDAALRALPARPAPADLRARLQARLDAEVSAPPALAAIRGGMRARPSRRRAWLAGFSAAAAAAAAALFVLVAGPSARRDDAASPASGLAARPTSDAPSSAATADPAGDAPEQAPGAEAGLAASARPDPGASPSAGEPPNPATVAAAASAGAAADSGTSLASDSAPAELGRAAADGALAPVTADPQGGGAAANVAAVANSDSNERTAELASAGSPGESAPPALWIEATDDEAAALGELEPADAGVVAVLDLLGALDALEAEAS
jgi:negative regulator of sigma E activity